MSKEGIATAAQESIKPNDDLVIEAFESEFTPRAVARIVTDIHTENHGSQLGYIIENGMRPDDK